MEWCSRDGAGEASVLSYPAIERARLDQQQLAARHNLHERLHVALEVRHAHSQRRGRLRPREQAARHRLDRTIPRTPRHPGNLLGRQTIRRASALVKSAGRIDRLRECRPHTDKVCRQGRAPSYRALLHRRPLAIRSRNPKMWTDLLHEVQLTAAERGARLLLRQRDPRNRLHGRDGRTVRDRRYGPHPKLRPTELTDLGRHDTALRFNRRWKALPVRYNVSGPESRAGAAASCPVVRNWRSAMTSHLAGRVSSGTTLLRPSTVVASLDDVLRGRSPCRLPAPVHRGHHAGGRPVACA